MNRESWDTLCLRYENIGEIYLFVQKPIICESDDFFLITTYHIVTLIERNVLFFPILITRR